MDVARHQLERENGAARVCLRTAARQDLVDLVGDGLRHGRWRQRPSLGVLQFVEQFGRHLGKLGRQPLAHRVVGRVGSVKAAHVQHKGRLCGKRNRTAVLRQRVRYCGNVQ